MSNSNIPGINNTGLKDDSQLPQIAVSTPLPQHLPAVYIYASQGPEVQITPANALVDVWGADTFDIRKPFFTHATALLNILKERANTVLVRRIRAAGAKNAFMTLVVDVNDTSGIVKTADRDSEGNFVVDGSGDVVYGDDVSGGRELTLRYVNDSDGTITDLGGGTRRFPIKTWTASSFGKNGNNFGIRTWVAKENTSSPVDNDVVDDQKALIINSSIIQLTASGKQIPLDNLYSSSIVKDSFKPNAYNYKTDANLDPQVIVSSYTNTESKGQSNIYGPIGEVNVHQESIDELVSELFEVENSARYKAFLTAGHGTGSEEEDIVKAYNDSKEDFEEARTNFKTAIGELDDNDITVEAYAVIKEIYENAMVAFEDAKTMVETYAEITYGEPVDDMYLIDFLTGTYRNGNPYEGIRISDEIGSTKVNESTTAFLMQGNDGVMSNSLFDTAVSEDIQYNSDNVNYPLVDMARYPLSIFYDSGFSVDTKEVLMSWTAKRPEVSVTIGTHVWGEAQLSVKDEIAAGTHLRSVAANYAESSLHGTPVTRICIFGHSGRLINSPYKEFLPLTLQVADYRAAYMGAGSGVLNSTKAYDDGVAGNNQVTLFTEVNNTFMTDTGKADLWNDGINYVQHFDTDTLFYPTFQTTNPNKGSVLNSDITMLLNVDIMKESNKVWTKLSGNSSLVDAEFLNKSTTLLLEALADKYGTRITVEVESVQTPEDLALGYPWTQNITVYANTAKSLMNQNITNRRKF